MYNNIQKLIRNGIKDSTIDKNDMKYMEAERILKKKDKQNEKQAQSPVTVAQVFPYVEPDSQRNLTEIGNVNNDDKTASMEKT